MRNKLIKFWVFCLVASYFVLPASAIYTPSNAMSCVLERIDAASSSYRTNVNVSDCRISNTEIKNYFWDGASGYKFRELIDSFQYSYTNSIVDSIIIKYRYNRNSTIDLIKQYDTSVNEIIASLPNTNEPLDTLFYLYNYLARTTAYNTDAASNAANFMDPNYTLYFSLYGPIYYKSAVCSGYSQAYMNILKQIGYDVLYLTSEAMNHGWNLVRYKNNYYHVDVTYADPIPNVIGYVDYKYFMMNDSEVGNDHTWEDHTLVSNSLQLNRDNYIFNKNIKDAYYYDGYWYYVLNNGIYRSLIDGSDQSLLYNASRVMNITMKNNKLYFTTTNNNYYVDSIYELNLQTNQAMLLSKAASSTYISGLYYENENLLLNTKNGVQALKVDDNIEAYSYLQNLSLSDDNYLYLEFDLGYHYYESAYELAETPLFVFSNNSDQKVYELSRVSSTTFSLLLELADFKSGNYAMILRYQGNDYPLTQSLVATETFTNINSYQVSVNNNQLVVNNPNTQSFDYSAYGNGLLPIYPNSRVTYAQFYNNYLSINGYAFEANASYDKPNSYVRELVLVELNTNLEYRVPLNASYNDFLNANVNLNPNQALDFSYAFYKTMVNFNRVYTYWDKVPTALPDGEYRAFIRLSDGVRSNVIPLQNLLPDTKLCEEFYMLEGSNDVGFSYKSS